MQAIYDKLNVHSRLEASIGHSRKWDAYAAGREVAETAIKNLKHPPSFFVVFSTMHYRKNGGFRKFLDGIWEILPDGTPLIGGTVAGFINNYGSLFIGQDTAESLGDYTSGLNHTLPTNTAARYTGGLSVKDFIKLQTTLRCTKEGLANIGPGAEVLAKSEGLDAHARSVRKRLKDD